MSAFLYVCYWHLNIESTFRGLGGLEFHKSKFNWMLLNEKVELDLIQKLFLKAESGIKTIMKMSKNLKKKSVTYIKL